MTYGPVTHNWQNGRQLASVSMSYGAMVYSYEYNDSGIRTSKTSLGIKHEYTLNGSQIVTETWTQGGVEHFIVYLYDESGAPIGMQYRTSNYAYGEFDNYYYEKNLFGDVVAIYNEAGTKIGSYKYDAWGVCTASVVATSSALDQNVIRTLNPFRYRGYYYDTETGYYYLQSRYYNPQWGRFLNADGYINANGDLLGFNMFAYCSNNPVMYTDPSGEMATWLIVTLIVTAAVITIAAATAVIYEVATSEPNTTEYSTEDDATAAWANEYKNQSKDFEMGAMLYKITDDEGNISYTYGRTYKGNDNNIVLGFIIAYTGGGIKALFSSDLEMIGFIHSHPEPPQGTHNDFPSAADLNLHILPGINNVYVVPYAKDDSNVPDVFAARDFSSWYFSNHTPNPYGN